MLTPERINETEIINTFKDGVVPVDRYYVTQFSLRLNIFYPYFTISDSQIVGLTTGRKDIVSVRFCQVEALFLGEIEDPAQELPTSTLGESWMQHLVRIDTLEDGTRLMNLPRRWHFAYEDPLAEFSVVMDSDISVRPCPTT